MKNFDRERCRQLLDGDIGGFEWALACNFEDAKNAGGLANSARANLHMAIECLLVDYDEPARLLAQRAEEWLVIAIREDERPRVSAPFGPESWRHLGLAQARWLLSGVQDTENSAKFVEYRDQFLAETRPTSTEVSLNAPSYLSARAFREAARMLDTYGIKAPKSLSAIRGEGTMCYALCQHELEGMYSEDEIRRATERFLKRNVNGWLTHGHYLDAAEWMKIANWAPGGLTPKEVVMKCYDYLPTETKPRP